MAMIICKECGKHFSSYAACCPECGCPVNNTPTPINNNGNTISNLGNTGNGGNVGNGGNEGYNDHGGNRGNGMSVFLVVLLVICAFVIGALALYIFMQSRGNSTPAEQNPQTAAVFADTVAKVTVDSVTENKEEIKPKKEYVKPRPKSYYVCVANNVEVCQSPAGVSVTSSVEQHHRPFYLQQGWKILSDGELKNGYLRVYSGNEFSWSSGKSGWVHRDYLRKMTREDQMEFEYYTYELTCQATDVKIRYAPNKKSETVVTEYSNDCDGYYYYDNVMLQPGDKVRTTGKIMNGYIEIMSYCRDGEWVDQNGWVFTHLFRN